MPAFKGINSLVDSDGTIYAVRHVLKQLNNSESQQPIVFIYILNSTTIKQKTVHCLAWSNERE